MSGFLKDFAIFATFLPSLLVYPNLGECFYGHQTGESSIEPKVTASLRNNLRTCQWFCMKCFPNVQDLVDTI